MRQIELGGLLAGTGGAAGSAVDRVGDAGHGDGSGGTEGFGAVLIKEDDGELVVLDAELAAGGELVAVVAGVNVFSEDDVAGAVGKSDERDENGVELAELEIVSVKQLHLLTESSVGGVGREDEEGAGIALELQNGVLRVRWGDEWHCFRRSDGGVRRRGGRLCGQGKGESKSERCCESTWAHECLQVVCGHTQLNTEIARTGAEL
jgi:hypothetical protein